jgi:hypothetical protein
MAKQLPERLFDGKAAAATFAAALATAIFFPFAGPGIGAFLGGVAIAAAFLFARGRPQTEQWGFGLAGLAMLGLIPIRAADWLAALLIFGALATSTIAAAAGPRWRDIFAAPLRLLMTIEHMPRFFASPFKIMKPTDARWRPVLRGVVLAVILVLVFGLIFASADEAFAQVTGEFFGILEFDFETLPARFIIFLMSAVAAAALALGVMKVPAFAGESRHPAQRVRRSNGLEWRIGLVALDFVFAVFVAIQFAVLFGGRTHLLRTGGLTYAEYARSGFFQLVVVALLTLAVIALAMWFSPSENSRDRLILRVLLGTLCGLTVVVLVSAHFRLSLYEDAYGFTRARLFGHGFIALLAAIFGAIMLAGILWKARWLPRTVVALAAISVLAFGIADPDRLIASQNLQRFDDTGKIDLLYLSSLSPDAVPVLMELPSALRSCALEPMTHRLQEADNWNDWNYSRQRARRLIASENSNGSRETCDRMLREDFESADLYR